MGFPFKYEDKEYYQCTYANSPTPWCATKVDPNGQWLSTTGETAPTLRPVLVQWRISPNPPAPLSPVLHASSHSDTWASSITSALMSLSVECLITRPGAPPRCPVLENMWWGRRESVPTHALELSPTLQQHPQQQLLQPQQQPHLLPPQLLQPPPPPPLQLPPQQQQQQTTTAASVNTNSAKSGECVTV